LLLRRKKEKKEKKGGKSADSRYFPGNTKKKCLIPLSLLGEKKKYYIEKKGKVIGHLELAERFGVG